MKFYKGVIIIYTIIILRIPQLNLHFILIVLKCFIQGLTAVGTIVGKIFTMYTQHT
jgi:hypothetical protein